MKKIFLIICLSGFIIPSHAGPIIGEPCPNFVFDSLINHKKQKFTMADLRGKFVILDFWGTFCTPCIADIPRMEKIQQKFGDKLELLMMVTDGYAKAVDFYAVRKKNNRPIALACAANEKVKDYFEIRFVPTFVWIDDKGIVRGITDYSQLTDEKLAAFTSGKDVALRQLQKEKKADMDKFLLTTVQSVDSSVVQYHSLFTNFLQGAQSAYIPANYGRKKIMVFNMPPKNFYQIAYGDSVFAVTYNRTLIEASHPENITMPKDGDWIEWSKTHTYCYELSVPPSRQKDIRKIMQKDLDRFFGLHAYWEPRVRKCLILKKIGGLNFPPNKDTATFMRISSSGFTMINRDYRWFVDAIQHYRQDMILLDETGIADHPISLVFKADMTDPASVNDALRPLGLSLTLEDRTVDMLIISDKGK